MTTDPISTRTSVLSRDGHSSIARLSFAEEVLVDAFVGNLELVGVVDGYDIVDDPLDALQIRLTVHRIRIGSSGPSYRSECVSEHEDTCGPVDLLFGLHVVWI